MDRSDTNATPPPTTPLVDPVPLPAIAAGESWQHVLLESRLQTARKVVGTQKPTQKRWVWALLLSCPQPIPSFDAIGDLPRGAVLTVLVAGELRDAEGLRAHLSERIRAVIDRLPLTSAEEVVEVSMRDGTTCAGVFWHLSNDPDVNLRTGARISWSEFERGRSSLLETPTA